MVDITLKGLKIKEKSGSNILTEEYRKNIVEIVAHLTKLRGKKFKKCLANRRKFKIIVRRSKLPDYKAPWIRNEECVLKPRIW